jgi:hypothetical protein
VCTLGAFPAGFFATVLEGVREELEYIEKNSIKNSYLYVPSIVTFEARSTVNIRATTMDQA